MAPAPWDPQDVAPKRDEASRLGSPAECLALVADRPENAPPAPENPERPAPGNGVAGEEPPACEALEGPAASEAPLIDRLEMAPQAPEKMLNPGLEKPATRRSRAPKRRRTAKPRLLRRRKTRARRP